MNRTKHIAVAASLAIIASVAIGALAADPTSTQRKRSAPAAAVGRTTFRVAVAGAPQTELDRAMFVAQPFFDVSARVPRPYAEARPLVAALAEQYPSDPRVELNLGRLDERLGNFDVAATEMEAYAKLSGREPNALRRLGAFYRGRARAADEIRTLEELAAALPPKERAPVYRRAIAAYNDGRPGLRVEPIYEKLIDADPADGAALSEYVNLLLASHDTERALGAVDHAAAANPNPPREVARRLLLERARIYDSLGQRQQALGVYERVFDPLWPRAVAADYYALLSRYGLYPQRRRALQAEVAAGSAPFATVARLFNFYAYEGNLPAGERLLASVESSKKGTAWPSSDLELAANLYVQVDDLDQASRYLYSLYLQNGLAPGSADRERILSPVPVPHQRPRRDPIGARRHLHVCRRRPDRSSSRGTQRTPFTDPCREQSGGGVSRRGVTCGWLHERRARALDLRAVSEGVPDVAAPGPNDQRPPQRACVPGADKDVVQVGSAFLARFASAPEYEAVALKVANANVRMQNRAAERKVLLDLLDRAAAKQPANRPLLDRSTSRWIYHATPNPTDETEESEYDAPDSVFVAPNGTPIGKDEAGRFGSDDDETADDSFEPTSGSSRHLARPG